MSNQNDDLVQIVDQLKDVFKKRGEDLLMLKDQCREEPYPQNLINFIEKREKLRTYEEGKILHNKSAVLIFNYDIETNMKIKGLSDQKLKEFDVPQSQEEKDLLEKKEKQITNYSNFILSTQSFKLTLFLNLTIKNNRVSLNHLLNSQKLKQNRSIRTYEKKDILIDIDKKYILNFDEFKESPEINKNQTIKTFYQIPKGITLKADVLKLDTKQAIQHYNLMFNTSKNLKVIIQKELFIDKFRQNKHILHKIKKYKVDYDDWQVRLEQWKIDQKLKKIIQKQEKEQKLENNNTKNKTQVRTYKKSYKKIKTVTKQKYEPKLKVKEIIIENENEQVNKKIEQRIIDINEQIEENQFIQNRNQNQKNQPFLNPNISYLKQNKNPLFTKFEQQKIFEQFEQEKFNKFRKQQKNKKRRLILIKTSTRAKKIQDKTRKQCNRFRINTFNEQISRNQKNAKVKRNYYNFKKMTRKNKRKFIYDSTFKQYFKNENHSKIDNFLIQQKQNITLDSRHVLDNVSMATQEEQEDEQNQQNYDKIYKSFIENDISPNKSRKIILILKQEQNIQQESKSNKKTRYNKSHQQTHKNSKDNSFQDNNEYYQQGQNTLRSLNRKKSKNKHRRKNQTVNPLKSIKYQTPKITKSEKMFNDFKKMKTKINPEFTNKQFNRQSYINLKNLGNKSLSNAYKQNKKIQEDLLNAIEIKPQKRNVSSLSHYNNETYNHKQITVSRLNRQRPKTSQGQQKLLKFQNIIFNQQMTEPVKTKGQKFITKEKFILNTETLNQRRKEKNHQKTSCQLRNHQIKKFSQQLAQTAWKITKELGLEKDAQKLLHPNNQEPKVEGHQRNNSYYVVSSKQSNKAAFVNKFQTMIQQGSIEHGAQGFVVRSKINQLQKKSILQAQSFIQQVIYKPKYKQSYLNPGIKRRRKKHRQNIVI